AAVTTQVGKMEQSVEKANLRIALESQLTEIIHPIEKRIESYELLLSGIRGSFDVSGGVTRKGFEAYVNNIGICDKLPETSGVSVSFRVSKDNLAHFNEKMRIEHDDAEGHLEYQVISFPKMNGTSQHAPVSYMVPPNPNVIGKDNFEDKNRKVAMIKSQISGSATLSDPIQLWQKESAKNHDGYLMFLPFYKHGSSIKTPKERYDSIEGWTAVAFNISELIKELFHNRFSTTQLTIEDTSTQNGSTVVFQSSVEKIQQDELLLSVKKEVNIANRNWIFTLSAPRESQLSKQYSNNIRSIIISGSIISILLTFFIYFLVQRRADSFLVLHKLHEAAEKLKQNETRYKKIFYESGVNMLIIDQAGTIVDANNHACDYYGYPLEQIRGMHISEINTLPKEEVQRKIQRAQFEGKDRFDFHHRLASGVVRSVEVSTSVIEFDSRKHILSIIEDTTERNEAISKILYMANHDALTGLPNRNFFLERFKLAISHAQRSKKQIALMFLDLDNFKDINDTIGHDIGDELLKQVADRMKRCIRDEDMVARQGGDEFLVLLSDIENPDGAEIVAKKLNETLARPYEVGEHTLHISASIGIAIYPDDSNSIDELMKYADEAMYGIKAMGRNGYKSFSREMHTRSSEKQLIVSHLHNALTQKELQTYYQPVIHAKTSQLLGFEALMRWKNDELGVVSPSKFIPIAEDCGLIIPMENWIIRDVCKTIKEWEKMGLRVPRVAINLSIRHFQSSTLVADIMSILDEMQVSTQSIGFEITENMLIDDMESAANKIRELTNKGFEISIDDFGTKYSNLSYLRNLQFGKLKIDKSFIDNLDDKKNRLIVHGIITFAHTLNLKVVAEGVETRKQVELLKEMECDSIQGYYFGHPENQERTTVLLSRS
ncbi:EAL domain-containing protein, partial [Candidatus Gracilibacteria bacterium]|nr:EAL domain-containing protein [Candidatus Gracilibacteria bacterium]